MLPKKKGYQGLASAGSTSCGQISGFDARRHEGTILPLLAEHASLKLTHASGVKSTSSDGMSFHIAATSTSNHMPELLLTALLRSKTSLPDSKRGLPIFTHQARHLVLPDCRDLAWQPAFRKPRVVCNSATRVTFPARCVLISTTVCDSRVTAALRWAAAHPSLVVEPILLVLRMQLCAVHEAAGYRHARALRNQSYQRR